MVKTIAIDTNILIRFLTGDDKEQFERALDLFDSHRIWISNTVLIETEWVLRKPLAHSKAKCIQVFETLIKLENIAFENETVLDQAIQAYKIGMDFADAMHLYSANNNELMLHSFDKALIKHARSLNARAQLA